MNEPDEDGRVCLVCLFVQCELRSHDAVDIVRLCPIVIGLEVVDWEEAAIPNTGVVQDGAEDEVENDDADKSVGDCLPG